MYGDVEAMMDDDSKEPRRQVARRERRTAGEQSARLAKKLMDLSSSALGSLNIDEELRDAIKRARAVTSPKARRRAERTLASDLRDHDIDDLDAALGNVAAAGSAETRLFKLAESWRERLIDEGIAAADEFPGGAAVELRTLIEKAQRERDTGRPRGAARALFRYVFAALKGKGASSTSPTA